MNREQINETLVKALREMGATEIEFHEDGRVKRVVFATPPPLLPFVAIPPGQPVPIPDKRRVLYSSITAYAVSTPDEFFVLEPYILTYTNAD